MTSIPTNGKEFSTTSWKEMPKGKDKYDNSASKAFLLRLESLQEYVKTGKERTGCPYIKDVVKMYKELRYKKGNTCTTAATMLYKEMLELI